MGDESDAHANGAAGLHVVDLDEAESFVDGDGGAAPPNLVPPSLTIEPGGPDALGKYGADALTKPSDGGEGTTGGEPSRGTPSPALQRDGSLLRLPSFFPP